MAPFQADGRLEEGILAREAASAVRVALEERSVTVTTVADDEDVVGRFDAAAPEAVVIVGLPGTAQLYRDLVDAGYSPAVVPVVWVATGGSLPDAGTPAVADARAVLPIELADDVLADRLPVFEPSRHAAQAYDAVIIVALAAEAAGSAAPGDVADQIPEVTASGAQCFSFAECRDLLRGGADIDYQGVAGPYAISAEQGIPTVGTYRVVTLGEDGRVASQEVITVYFDA